MSSDDASSLVLDPELLSPGILCSRAPTGGPHRPCASAVRCAATINQGDGASLLPPGLQPGVVIGEHYRRLRLWTHDRHSQWPGQTGTLACPARRGHQPFIPCSPSTPMDGHQPIDCFMEEWRCYLGQHGQRHKTLSRRPGILVSRNGRGRRYRWLLWCVEGNDVLLAEDQLRTIRVQARLAKKMQQQCFVVIKFGHPGGCAVATPAAQAVKVRFISSNRGAIPWDP